MATSKVLVVGSGVIGLRTSVELLKRNVPVVLRSPKPPLDPSNCSQGAGGFWMPFHCDDPRVERWCIETLDELHPMATKGYPPSSNRLVELMPTVIFHPDSKPFEAAKVLPNWLTDVRLNCQHLTTEMLWWQNSVHKLRIPTEKSLQKGGYSHAWLFDSPIVDSPKMLQHMLDQVEQDPNSNVDVETNEYYESIDHVMEVAKSLGCNKVLNATGLGASALCNDPEVFGARGVLLQYDRANCVRKKPLQETPYGPMLNDAVVVAEEGPWGSDELPTYMIPRGDIIVVGGSYLEHDMEPQIRPQERTRLLQNAKILGIDTDSVQPIGEWTGFRPYRAKTRLEVDTQYSTDDVSLVHCYGTGGSGWTVYVGCAKDATNLLLEN